MTLVERLEALRKKLDWDCCVRATTGNYDLEIASLRDLIKCAEDKIKELANASKPK